MVPAADGLATDSTQGACEPQQKKVRGLAAVAVGFITDTEGNFDYWCRCVELSRVVCFGPDGTLQFVRQDEQDIFVFGGDVFDKGPGDIRIASALVDLKTRYPDRVILLVGNRDLNKLRFAAELGEDEIDVPQPVPTYPRAPPQVSYRAFLDKTAAANGTTAERENVRANRLRWILDHTMTAQGVFEYRRQEMAILRAAACSESGPQPEAPSDEEVAQHFLDSVLKDDGICWRYLHLGQVAALVGATLFVHGGVPPESIGWVPGLDMRYRAPQDGDVCGGTTLPVGHSLQQWVDAMNDVHQRGLQDFRAQPTWREDRTRGGESLLAVTSSPACFGRSVVVESLLQAGTPLPLDPRVEEYLANGGVSRMVCGHKPCGDSPFVLGGRRVEVVHCDTTYSDHGAPDQRGQVVAAVELEGDVLRNRTHIRGVLRDGSLYDFALPELGDRGSIGERGANEGQSDGDAFIGHQTRDGWWIKARLEDGEYHVARSKPGDRNVSYKRVSPDLLLDAPSSL
eukprot:CAMPEP_0204114176 /NCGR_PEP_ID=MMETSP0361-20130328/4094_1 /ASSEMBLY_ACC=CAM_ASM_000343 /TAXON_ID=268821 /ORGANISM="Scrippsiella Hangoei, Strain SHTV-5" /LENGTH=511 /DNA_ID=CAMNT_0051064659 /DNA_START=50 /DNA_END=1585 /DNA_ORIENTATION=-